MERPDHDCLRVALLCGGTSAEREVSLASGARVDEALRAAGHRVTRIDPAETAVESIDWRAYDLCFLSLHGGAGEDGRLQQRLDRLGVVYTGSGAAPSQRAMHKSLAKACFHRQGVPTPAFFVFDARWGVIGSPAAGREARASGGRPQFPAAAPKGWPQGPGTQRHVHPNQPHLVAAAERLGYPLIVKPDGQGSSLAVSVAEDAGGLGRAVEAALRYGPTVLIERFVAGREFTVSLLDRRPLPLLEVVAPGAVFDYEAKYGAAGTQYHFDPPLPPILAHRLPYVAVAAAEVLETAGLVRVDLRLDHRGAAWVLEVNTLPGMTANSLAPMAAARAGMNLAELCGWMLREALGRTARRRLAA